MARIDPANFKYTLKVMGVNAYTYGDKTEATFGEIRQATDGNGRRLVVRRILANEFRQKFWEAMPQINHLCVADINQQSQLIHPNIGTPMAVICSPFATVFENMEFRFDGLCRSVKSKSGQYPKPCITLADFIRRIEEFDLFDYIEDELLHDMQEKIALDTAKALKFLHSCGIAHGSFAAESVLITSSNTGGITCKVIDHGEAYTAVRDLINNNDKPKTLTEVMTKDVKCYGEVLHTLLFQKPEGGVLELQDYEIEEFPDSDDNTVGKAYLERDFPNSENDEEGNTDVGACFLARPKSELVVIAHMCCREYPSMAEVEAKLLMPNSLDCSGPSKAYTMPMFVSPLVECEANVVKDPNALCSEMTTANKTSAKSTLRNVKDLNALHRKGLPHTKQTAQLPFKYAIHSLCDLDHTSETSKQMPKYKLPLAEKATKTCTKSRLCVVQDPNPLQSNPTTDLPRTIVMMGATGAGKSTLIEGLVNYAYGVEWTDDFRFTIIDLKDEEKANKAASQAKSQTEWITTYVIRPAAGGRIAFLLRVVDMPGFGDTAGIDKDKELVKRLGELFAIPEEKGGIEQVDMVCLVVQASLARLTASQSYILNSLKEIFDKSIAENICAFITFNDGSTVPPVLAALKQSKTPFQKHFVFNNSALYDSNKASGFSTMHWDKGLVNYRNMLEELQTMQSKSLQCSKEVLDKRAKIQAMTVNLKNEIAKGLSDLDELTQEAKVLKQREHEAEQNRDYTYEVTERIMKKRPTSSSAMNCDTCKKSCHYPCGVKANLFKRTCAVMSWSAECTVCSNCSTSSHSIENFEYHLFEQTVTKTHEDMKKRYFDATKGGDVHQNMVNNMKRKFLETQARVKSLMDQIMKCEEELSELALTKSSPISRVEYLKMMRDTEDRTRDPGYKHRIKMYDDAIEEQNLMADAGSTSFNPWGKYIDLLDI